MSQAASVIEELEYVLAAGSSDRRSEILRRVTDLFLGNADDFTREQVGFFDDVLAHLIRQVETTALAELGAKLAPVGNAPSGVIRSLARHDEITVAGPVLARSVQLTDGDLWRSPARKARLTWARSPNEGVLQWPSPTS